MIEEIGSGIFPFFEQVARKAQKHGLQFAYHNHAFEFEEKVGEQFVFDALYDALPPVLAQVEMDLGWVQYIGQDPLAYTAKYSGRLPLLHLKDFRYAEDGGIDTLELGRGIIHLPRCFKPPRMPMSSGLLWSRTGVKIRRLKV